MGQFLFSPFKPNCSALDRGGVRGLATLPARGGSQAELGAGEGDQGGIPCHPGSEWLRGAAQASLVGTDPGAAAAAPGAHPDSCSPGRTRASLPRPHRLRACAEQSVRS